MCQSCKSKKVEHTAQTLANAYLVGEIITITLQNGQKSVSNFDFATLTAICEGVKTTYQSLKQYNGDKDRLAQDARMGYILKLEILPIFKQADANLKLIPFVPSCYDCDAEIPEYKDALQYDGKYICSDCEDSYCECSECKEVITRDDSYSFDDKYYCESCYNDNTFCCEKCEDTFAIGDEHTWNDRSYCDNCVNEISGTCDDCGSRYDTDDLMYSDSNDCYYCQDCYGSNDDDSEFESTNIDLSKNTFRLIRSKHKFGIELEIDAHDLPYSEIENETCFGSKHDGSLDKGMEFYSPILQGDKGYNAVKKFCDTVGTPKPSESAGFHLHIDAGNFTPKNLRNIWLTYKIIEDYIFMMLPPSRTGNRYCKKSPIELGRILEVETKQGFKNLWKCEENDYGDRYKGLNLEAFYVHGTVELRYHSGTADFDKIINWVKFNLDIVDFALNSSVAVILSLKRDIERFDNKHSRFRAIIKKIVKQKQVRDYLQKRFNKFQGERVTV